MRLLHIEDLTLREFPPDRIPNYSILSHTWGTNEITYEDMVACGGRLPYTPAASKIRGFCAEMSRLASLNLRNRKRIEWVWVDTCCIKKTADAELSESINSMYRWCQDAAECIVYLEDVRKGETSAETNERLKYARWFKRGWTLQELLASRTAVMFVPLILAAILDAAKSMWSRPRLPFDKYSPQERLSWAWNRQTTRPEDRAYSLLGIFDVSMPMIYGEGKVKAFKRLKREIREEHGVELDFSGI
jgi:hypothetical protein